MDKQSSYIMLGIIVFVILPFVLNTIIKRMRTSKLLNALRNSARHQNINISHDEVIHRKYAIGIDREAKKLAYLNGRKEGSLIVTDLNEVSNCKVIISDKLANNVTHSVELAFLPRTNNKSSLKLEFYNNPAFMPSSDDIAIADRWAEIINSTI